MVEHNFMVHVTVNLLLIQDGKILLMKRKNTGYEDNKYGSIGGHLEENEDFKTSLIREAKEEINIILEKEDLKFICIIHSKGVTDNYVNIFFTCSKYLGDIRNNETNKCSELKWFRLDSLPSNIIEIEKKAIENFHDMNYLIEYGW